MKNQRLHSFLYVFCFGALLQLCFIDSAYAACGAASLWQADANTTAWNTANNWNNDNVPNGATETAVIRADWRIPLFPGTMTLSCFEIQSGSMTAANGILTIDDDYFRNLNAGSLAIGATTFQVTMGGTTVQTFENVDPIPRLTISNPTTVTLTQPFVVTNAFTINAGSGNLIIAANMEVQQTGVVTIPSSAIVTVSSGVEWKLNGGLTINGVLRLMPGARLTIANGRTLSVGATGTLEISGVSGNAAIIDSYNSASTYTFNVAGRIDAEYFSIGHMTAPGMNITGQIIDLSNGAFNYIPTSGYGITLGAAVTSPTTLYGLGFFAPGATTPRNVNATAFAGTAITIDDYSGIGGVANETDPSNKINWGTQSPPDIVMADNSPAGAPPATIGVSAGYTHFGTFAFSLSNAATATDITSIKFTLDGINNSSDVTGVRVYRETDNNCAYNAGVDTLVNTYVPVGSPATFTATFAAGNIQINGTAPRCVHVLLSTSATAQAGNTIGIKISSTDDIINSLSYNLSSTSGPPISAGTATLTGGNLSRWNGSTAGGNITLTSNWTPNTVPTTTRDCQIGSGYSIPLMGSTLSCLNGDLLNGGTLNWNSTANIFSLTGALSIASGFVFQNTTAAAIMRFAGTTAQSVNFHGTTFPGNVQVTNTTGPVTFEGNATIGSLTLSGGTTRIASGVTLQVNGNIAINSPAVLDIEPGAVLLMGNGTSITVASGATLEMVGTPSVTSDIRAVNNASSFTVAVTGTIRAQYYSFKNLGATGVTINAAATIDATNRLQNGSYTYPLANNTQMLRLLRQVPTNTLDSMTFDSGGSAATGVKSVTTNTTAGTLNMTNYSGSWTGSANSTSVNYIVTWVNETNTIDLTQEATAPASANQGDVINAGRFGFKQTDAGAFANTDITFLRLTLTGTGSANDVDYAALYYDSACTGTGGTLIGTQSFTGSPARADFSGITGATVQSNATTPPKRCFYVMLSISSTATNGATVGVQIASNAHVSNSQNFGFNGAASPPIATGTTSIIGNTTYWTGATNTVWTTATNWNGGVPTATMNCVINDQTNDPTISTGVATCKTVTIGTGTLTMTGGALHVYGSFDNSGTFNQSTFPLIMRDNGTVATSQVINNGSGTLNNLQFNKTAGGSVTLDGSILNVTTAITFPSGNNFTFYVGANKTLSAIGGINLTGGALSVAGGGLVEIGASQTLTVNGGSLITTGTNDAYPQSLTNKGKFTRRGGTGTWNLTATSGTINLVGFVFEWLGTAGLNIGGTTNVTQINGGQLRSLPSTAGMRAIQLSTTGALPSTISNFGWYWGSGNTVPTQATSYFLGFSSGCSNRTVSFDQWFGDFWPYTTTNTDAKISETACNIVIDRANSPVSLTEFKATPYNGQVVLEWTTGLEWYHKGFNIYRSLSPSTGFTQLNSEMIRNDMFNTNMHGTYAFIDSDVINGTTYYYKLEDISTIEEHTLHGPVSAIPSLAMGAAPPPLANTIVGNNPGGSQSSGGTGSTNATPGLVELEPNVTLLAKTSSSYRLKITIPAHQLTADVGHPTYNHATIPLYSKTIDAGKPELLTRTLMLKIPSATAAQMTIVSEVSAVTNGILLAPAPAWVLVGNQYQYQWSLDAAAYANSTSLPAQPISLGTIINDNGQHYLPVVIKPLSYAAATQDLKKYDEVVVDVFLDTTTSWSPQTPVAINTLWGTQGALRIGLAADGIYELSYDDMMNAGVIAPFDHGDVTKFKLFFMNQEQPIDVTSSSGLFSSGDTIRFFAPNTETIESFHSYVLLVPDYASPVPGLRMANVDVSALAGIRNPNPGFLHRVHLEENNVAVFNEPYDQNLDLFVWGLFTAEVGGAQTALTTDVELPNLIHAGTVSIQVTAKSRATTAINYESNVQLSINDNVVGDVTFSGSNVQVLSFNVSPTYFVAGKNKLSLTPTGANLVNGEWDLVYIDAIDINYNQAWMADNDQILLANTVPAMDIFVDNFSSNDLYVYDLSQFGDAKKWTNAAITSNGTYGVEFQTPSDPSQGRRIWISNESKLLTPASLELNYGSNLASTANQADVVYVGSPELLDAVEPLANYRKDQGFKTKLVTLQSVYNEFGQGIVSHEAIRDFFVYAKSSWNVKPRYFVLLGDGTYDPKAYQNADIPNRFPVKLMKGAAFNYGSDHWFVTKENEQLPFAIVGRIPARTATEMTDYVQKVLKYEAGTTRPAPSMTILSDKAHYTGENFDAFSLELKARISSQSKLKVSNKSRTGLGDAAFKTSVTDSFNNSSVIHYMGHGAENMWADNFIFNVNDVDTLTNTKLPVIAAMDCLNANFYDPTMTSLAEKLVMKKDAGAIVFWGSTSMTPPSVQHVYQKAFYDRLLDSKTSTVGDAVNLSKAQAHQESPFEEAILSWTIIGDPMIKASLPESQVTAPAAGSGGGSSGCSAFGGFKDNARGPAYDLALALLLETLIALALIKTLVRLSRRH